MSRRAARSPRYAQRLSFLARLQLGIEALYRVETRLGIDAFVIDAGARAAAGVGRAPREQLLVQEDTGGVALGLFVDADALANLERHDPAAVGIDDRNFGDFCLAVEGVSHFIYVAICAAGDRLVSQLELELQAEVDKFACCLLVGDGFADRATGGDAADAVLPADLRRRLFEEVALAGDLDADESDRYRAANAQAGRYADALDRRYLRPARIEAMLTELRRFYRMDLPDKLAHIARLA